MHRALATAVLLLLAATAPAAGQDALKGQEAATALAKGNAQQALVLYTEALKDPALPSDRRAAMLSDRGVVHARLNQPRLAIEDFNRAVQLFPEYAAVYNNRGNTLLALGLTREALKDFDRAIVLAPGYAAAYNNRASAYMRLGQTAESIQDYTKAIELMPTSAAPLSGRGRVFLAQQRPHAAIRDFSRALQADARFAQGYRARAEAKIEVERYDEAVEDLSRAAAFDPNNAEVYVLRGYAYLRAKNPASAIKDFTKAIEIDANSAAAHQGRGLAHAKVEAYEEAETDLARALELDPRSALAFAYRALVYKLAGQADLGAREIDKAVRLEPNRAEVLWVRGELHEAQGRPEEAIASLRLALLRQPGLTEAAEALQRLGAAPDTSADRELPGAGIERWQVVARGQRFFAVSDEYPRLRVPLEMMGEGQPKLLEWDVKKPPLKGIGILRFQAGRIAGKAAPEEVEQAAIVDVQAGVVVAILPHRQGERVANWTWDEGRVTIASVDGVTDEFSLRAVKPPASAPRRVTTAESWQGPPSWVPWGNSPWDTRPRGGPPGQQRQKPKTLFNLLFGN